MCFVPTGVGGLPLMSPLLLYLECTRISLFQGPEVNIRKQAGPSAITTGSERGVQICQNGSLYWGASFNVHTDRRLAQYHDGRRGHEPGAI